MSISLSYKDQDRHNRSHHYGQESASTTKSILTRLSDLFVLHYLVAVPVLDKIQLEYYIAAIGENGIEWTVESCLVLIVASLGSICQQQQHRRTIISDGYSVPANAVAGPFDLNSTAFRYWNMAKKRLGWAMEESGLLSAQCLCLAGLVLHLPFTAVPVKENSRLNIAGT